MEEQGFWDNPEASQNTLKELKVLKDSFNNYDELARMKEDMETLIEMIEEENDVTMVSEVEEMMTSFKELFESVRIQTLLSEEYDESNAILRLNAGAGGTESCDWA